MFKRIIILVTLVVMLAVPCFGSPYPIHLRPTGDWFSAGTFKDTGYQWMLWADTQIGAGQGTGITFYVDSNVSNAGDGRAITSAFATVAGAIAVCEANRGDEIVLLQGHQEVEAASGNIFDLNVAGVTIRALSNGGRSGPVASGAATLNLMPVFILDHADATATMSAPNCRITGIRFESDVADNKIGLTISAAADGFVVDHCIFRDGAQTEELIIGINVAADADNGVLAYNTFSTVPSGGCDNAIVLAGGSDNTLVIGNIANGTYSAGAFLATAAASVNLSLIDNMFCNQGTIAADLHTSTTGILADNYFAGTSSVADTLTDHDAMWCFENYITDDDAGSGLLDPAAVSS